MKYIIAVIQLRPADPVLQSLTEKEIHLVTVSTVMGRAASAAPPPSTAATSEAGSLLKKVQLEIAVNEAFVKLHRRGHRRKRPAPARSATAKIFVLDLHEAIASAPAKQEASRSDDVNVVDQMMLGLTLLCHHQHRTGGEGAAPRPHGARQRSRPSQCAVRNKGERKMSKTTCMRAWLSSWPARSFPVLMSVLAAEGSLSVGGHWATSGGQLYNDEAVSAGRSPAATDFGLSCSTRGEL